jgi:hypothetical protein
VTSVSRAGSAQVAKLNKDSLDCQNNFRQLLQFYGYNPKDFDTGAPSPPPLPNSMVHDRISSGKKTTTEVFQLFHNFKEQVALRSVFALVIAVN